MKIIAGLGNPGLKYETTRHNAGFLAIDRLVDEWKADGPNAVQRGFAYQATVGGEKVLLVKPQTYMNLSGQCVAPLMKFYKLEPSDLIVIHDEIDLKPQSLQIKTGGGTAGNNGLKSIDASLGAGNSGYHRIRIGVGRPAPESPMSPADYVLQPFSDEELKWFDQILDRVVGAAELLVRGDVKSAQNKYNGSIAEKQN